MQAYVDINVVMIKRSLEYVSVALPTLGQENSPYEYPKSYNHLAQLASALAISSRIPTCHRSEGCEPCYTVKQVHSNHDVSVGIFSALREAGCHCQVDDCWDSEEYLADVRLGIQGVGGF